MNNEDKILNGEKTIVVDFDGTICEWAYPDMGKPKPYVRSALERIKELGYKIVIHTVRTASYHQEAIYHDHSENPVHHIKRVEDYLIEHNIPFDNISLYPKPKAKWYIDDRGITYDNNWIEIVEMIDKE